MRIPDRGSTTGDSPLDRPRAQRVGCPQGERSESIPPVHASAAEPVPDGGYALSGLRADLPLASPNISKCQHRAMSKCLMAAAPYQAYVFAPSQSSNLHCSVGRISVSAIRHFYP